MEKDEQNRVKSSNKGRRNADDVNATRGAVFYNPVQEFNRDISILAINEFNQILSEEKAAKGKKHEGIKVLEALAATGLRSVRYMKEIPSITTLVANDIDKTATDLMTKNFEFNDCPKEKYRGKLSSFDINNILESFDCRRH
jgi:tRNA G26 N,N-dimethylase Trm1